MWIWRRLEITWGFFLTPLIGVWLGAGPVLPSLYGAALLHELGHLVLLWACGARVERLRLTARGAEIQADTRYMPYGREILCCLGGPGVNLLLAVLLGHRGCLLAAGAHLLLGAYNLLPVRGLDGGRLLQLGISWLWGPWTADRICPGVGLASSVLLTGAAAVLFLRYHGGFFLVLAGIGLVIAQIAPCQTGGNQIK